MASSTGGYRPPVYRAQPTMPQGGGQSAFAVWVSTIVTRLQTLTATQGQSAILVRAASITISVLETLAPGLDNASTLFAATGVRLIKDVKRATATFQEQALYFTRVTTKLLAAIVTTLASCVPPKSFFQTLSVTQGLTLTLQSIRAKVFAVVQTLNPGTLIPDTGNYLVFQVTQATSAVVTRTRLIITSVGVVLRSALNGVSGSFTAITLAAAQATTAVLQRLTGHVALAQEATSALLQRLTTHVIRGAEVTAATIAVLKSRFQTFLTSTATAVSLPRVVSITQTLLEALAPLRQQLYATILTLTEPTVAVLSKRIGNVQAAVFLVNEITQDALQRLVVKPLLALQAQTATFSGLKGFVLILTVSVATNLSKLRHLSTRTMTLVQPVSPLAFRLIARITKAIETVIDLLIEFSNSLVTPRRINLIAAYSTGPTGLVGTVTTAIALVGAE